MIKKVDVIFFIEHKDREFETIEAITLELIKLGLTAIILSVYFDLIKLYKYKTKTVVFPYLLSKEDWPLNLVTNIFGENITYINMNWEQLISKVNEDYKKPQDDFVKKTVKHVSWSENFKENFLLKNNVLEENICITGNPANDILISLMSKNKEWRSKLSLQYSLDINKKWLFMPMNYGWAFSKDELINGKILAGYPSDIAWEHRSYAKKCLTSFIDFIINLANNSKYEIIIRPHPSISEEQYLELFHQKTNDIPQNIIINKDYSIREWIISSDVIGSSWSTSVWDAYNIGKKVFLYTPYARPDWLDVWWNNTIENVDSFNNISFSQVDVNINSNNSIEKISNYIYLMTKDNHFINPQLKFPKKKLIFLSILRLISCTFFKCKLFNKYVSNVKYDFIKKA
jgi:surface carbohydrate biosynthesis protein